MREQTRRAATVGVAENSNSAVLVTVARRGELLDRRRIDLTDPVPIASIAIRACPELPPAIEERIADDRAQTIADSVMYRKALATAAEARGRQDIDAFLSVMGRSIGPPWQAKQKLAAAAALAASTRP